MADKRLRGLERRCKETGAAEDEAAYLLERVRAGMSWSWPSYARLSELDVEAATGVLRRRLEEAPRPDAFVRLAALLGHEPAWRAGDAPEPWDLLDPRRAWLDALDDWDRDALAAGVVTRPDEGRIRATIAILDASTRRPGMTPCQLVQLRAALRLAEADLTSPHDDYLDGAPLYPIAEAAGEDVFSPARCLLKCFVDAQTGSGWPQAVASWVVEPHGLLSLPEAAHAVRQELVPWALGFVDPVGERVALRQRQGASDADNTVTSRGWIGATSILTLDPNARVPCPSCREGDLLLTEQGKAGKERWATCLACGRLQPVLT